MEAITTIGLDIAKSVFQVHGIDAEGNVIFRRQLKRRYVLTFFQKLHPCLVGIEACASSHHWSRELQALGHTVRNPFYYASLEVLAQSIEAVGSMDREAIAAYFRDRKFKTFLGELSMPGQIIDKVYTVGQWRGGFFKAVAGVGFSDYAQVNLKTSWG